MATQDTFERLESEVRSYSRSWPQVFQRAIGSELYSEEGERYLDLFAGAGALNYGHNPAPIKQALLDYLSQDHVVHGLDMMTPAKREFLEAFEEIILQPRGYEYKVMFPGPTGTNAVEAALKIARKVTGRSNVICFTNAFHGMTLGALAVSGDSMKRGGANVPLDHTQRLPYEDYFRDGLDTITYLERYLEDDGSGYAKPGAVILETIQGEGGLRSASDEWLQRLAAVCHKHDILLIADDIQTGCGRTGTFFSFEPSGIVPDIVTVSKSLSGMGLPFAAVLIKPELDQWQPSEHNGTFRGFNPAFVTARAALQTYWRDDDLAAQVRRKGVRIREGLEKLATKLPQGTAHPLGRGFMQGLEMDFDGLASQTAQQAFERNLLMETSGADDQAIKLLPSLTMTDAELDEAFAIIGAALDAAIAARDDIDVTALKSV